MILHILVIILLIILELVYFRVADKFNIIDKPNQRSSHTQITLRGGGVIFCAGSILYYLFFGFQYPFFLVGMLLISIVSFIDDLRSVSNKIRLIVQFAAMFLMFSDLNILSFSNIWIIIFALILCVGIINAYNFMDGINGITGGYSLVVLLSIVCADLQVRFIDINYLWVAIAADLVFCFFNFRKKAKCFAGDVGSVGIAFIILFALGKLILKTSDLTYILFLAVYGVDSVLTIIHRILLHENLGQAHRKHAYQLMANELRIPHIAVSMVYMLIQSAISAGKIFFQINEWMYFSVVLLILASAYVFFMKKYYYLHEQYLGAQGNDNQ